jgi:hypothetical protein
VHFFALRYIIPKVKEKVKQSRYRPGVVQSVPGSCFPDFMTTAQDGGTFVSLKHRPHLPLRNTPVTHFCYRLSRPQGHSATGRITILKTFNDNIGNRNRDLPVCSLVP